ncbi:serine O-acetyltransferase [Rhodococcus sp. LW-XY12]|uniref:serine O-acetyltransferase n=1 Tax=Rhodococcus sp. LW-XY12 TaxID=2856851 RepID=UPI001C563D1B|nr:serine acetyltransferase [Rhodococcus sp. LW-XY12]QXU53013.1 serine acetyltransferase [Rhodococcus sp. LW-XY12]
MTAKPDGAHSRRAYYLFCLKEDLRAHNLKKWRFDYTFRHPELYYQRIMRKVEYVKGSPNPLHRIVLPFWQYRLKRLSVRTGISVPPGVFGPGLSIAHYGSVVVNPNARVGSYCRIHSATNIGLFDGSAPVLGDRVYIGPGAAIYGGVKIGDGVAIGANAVVNSDVESNVTVAGVPAKVVSRKNSDRMLPGWFPPAESSQEDK